MRHPQESILETMQMQYSNQLEISLNWKFSLNQTEYRFLLNEFRKYIYVLDTYGFVLIYKLRICLYIIP